MTICTSATDQRGNQDGAFVVEQATGASSSQLSRRRVKKTPTRRHPCPRLPLSMSLPNVPPVSFFSQAPVNNDIPITMEAITEELQSTAVQNWIKALASFQVLGSPVILGGLSSQEQKPLWEARVKGLAKVSRLFRAIQKTTTTSGVDWNRALSVRQVLTKEATLLWPLDTETPMWNSKSRRSFTAWPEHSFKQCGGALTTWRPGSDLTSSPLLSSQCTINLLEKPDCIHV